MGEARPPRRAVFTADLRNGYRYFGRSPGWPGEAAALDAVRLLDSEVASLELADLSGFFCLDAENWVVVRGGLSRAHEPKQRYWREALALDGGQFARVRWNPFRVLPAVPDIPDEQSNRLGTPPLPDESSAQDDLVRVQELLALEPAAGVLLEPVLAAVLDADHTLLTGSTLGRPHLELLLLLLPPRLRPHLTFHAHALSVPGDPPPRLVLTPLADADAFDTPRPPWGHRLPRTAPEIGARAAGLAGAMVALLEMPAQLVEAQVTYEQYVARMQPAPGSLRGEVATVVRFARLLALCESGKASASLRVLAEAIAEHENTHHPEPLWLAGLLRGGFPPAALGAAVAEELRGPGSGNAPALLLERFAATRKKRPAEFTAFTRRVEQGIGGHAFSRDEGSTRRARTMLMLFAAARGDVDGMLTALPVPVDDVIARRLGGAEAWAPQDNEAVAAALEAFSRAKDTAGVLAAIGALGPLRNALPQGGEQVRLVEIAVALARWLFQRLSVEEWWDALPAAAAVLELAGAVTANARISLSRRPDSEHIRDMLSRSMNPAATLDADAHTDAEVFLGFLGLDASRSRLARRELADRGEALVQALLVRVRQPDGDGATSSEAVHWSLALLQRVHRGELDAAYVALALATLRAAVPTPGPLLRAFAQEHPAIAPLLLKHADAVQELGPADLTAVSAVALAETLRQAAAALDTGAVIALCEHLHRLGVRLSVDEVDGWVAPGLRGLAAELHAKSARPFTLQVSALTRALTPVVCDEALPIVQAALRLEPGEASVLGEAVPSPAARRTLADDGPTLLSHARRALPLLAAAAFGMMAVLLSSETGRRAVLGGQPPARSVAVPTAIDVATRMSEARTQAAGDDWASVVELLSGRTLDRHTPDAFAWDSLLAYAALRRGQRLQPDDVRRQPLLGLARDRAGRALETTPAQGTSGDLLRLIRAEACISASLGCDPAVVLDDLELAARSELAVVAERARRILQLLEE